MKIGKLEDTVKQILETNKSTNMNARQLGLPPFESVSRCRRKLQAKYEELRASIEVQNARAEKEMDMFEYALER